jgi:hypothetical protein
MRQQTALIDNAGKLIRAGTNNCLKVKRKLNLLGGSIGPTAQS